MNALERRAEGRMEMTKTNLKVLGRFLTGSRAYGYARPTSDYDYRHIHAAPLHEVASGLYRHNPKEGAAAPGLPEGVDPEDVASFELGHFASLLMKGTPNALELLFLPEECVLESHKALDALLERRSKFLTESFERALVGYVKGEMGAATKDVTAIEAAQGDSETLASLSHKTVRLPERVSHCVRLINMLREVKEQVMRGEEPVLLVQRPEAQELLRLRSLPAEPEVMRDEMTKVSELLEATRALPRLPEEPKTLREEIARAVLEVRLELDH